MTASHVEDTLSLALKRSGIDQAHVVHRPRLLSDNGPSYLSKDLAKFLADQQMPPYASYPVSSADPGQDRALASDAEEPDLTSKLLSARGSRSTDRSVCSLLQSSALSRGFEQSHPCRCVYGPRTSHLMGDRTDEKEIPETETLAAYPVSCLNENR